MTNKELNECSKRMRLNHAKWNVKSAKDNLRGTWIKTGLSALGLLVCVGNTVYQTYKHNTDPMRKELAYKKRITIQQIEKLKNNFSTYVDKNQESTYFVSLEELNQEYDEIKEKEKELPKDLFLPSGLLGLLVFCPLLAFYGEGISSDKYELYIAKSKLEKLTKK